jgi:ATP-binding cassette, subfamily C, bacterial CydC
LAKDLHFPATKRYVFGLIAAAIEAASAVALLATSAFLISRASEQPPILYLMVLVVGVRAFALGRATFRYLQRLALHDAVFRRLSEIRPILFEKLAQLAPGAISSRGGALENFTSDVERLQDWPLRVLTPLLQAFSAVVSGVTISILVFPFAALPMALTSIGFGVVALWLSAKSAANSEGVRVEFAHTLREQLFGVISNVDLVTNYGWSPSLRKQILNTGELLWKLDRRRVMPLALAAGTLSFGSAAVATISASLVGSEIDNVLPATLAIAVLMPLAIFDVFSQLQSVSQSHRGFKKAKSRLTELLEMEIPAELVVPEGSIDLDSVEVIEVTDLSIVRSGVEVLQHLECDFQRGRIAAIVGASGAGKTSLALALSSLISPCKGQIRINGRRIESYSIASRRNQILLIEQDPHIFRGTLGQNLEISGVSDEAKLLSVLRAVGLDGEFGARGSLATQISEDSMNISGGQAQRIAIARGLLAGASLLILDEPTSGLDRENSLSLMAVLRSLASKGVGFIVITHDPEISSLCDQQVELRNNLT